MKKITRNSAKFLFFSFVLVLILNSFAACSPSSLYSEGEGELKVLCTSFPPFDFARQIGGEKITLTVLQDNGADLHNYSPTTKTLKALSEADILICVGGDSDENWISDAISSSENPDLKVLRLTDMVELKHAELEGHNHEHDESENSGETEHSQGGDEHVWLSLKNAAAISDKINEMFAQNDAENAAYYKARTDIFKSKLTALDDEYAKAVSESKTKTVVVADRFPFIYLTSDYGICYYAAFSGCSTEVNSDFSTQVKLIEAVKAHSVPAVIVTEGKSKELADNICAQTGCKKVMLNSMQSVTRAEIQQGATYLDFMTANLTALKEALA